MNGCRCCQGQTLLPCLVDQSPALHALLADRPVGINERLRVLVDRVTEKHLCHRFNPVAGGFTIAAVALVSCSSWLRAADSRTAARSANHASDFCALVLVGISAGLLIAGPSAVLG